MSKNYDNSSMRVQDAVEACRMYPNNYLGDREIGGSTQTIHEIISNSTDEAKSGFGNKINITIHKDCSVTVEDFGRGIPVDWNPKQNMWNWDIAFQKIHGGGKLADDRSNYRKSGGQHGIGAGVTAMTSEWFKCESRRDGYIYSLEFKRGTFTGDADKVLKKTKDPKGKSQQTGTKISWKPDAQPDPNLKRPVFSDINYDLEGLKKWIKASAITTKGVSYNLVDEREGFKETYFYKNGMVDFVKELTNNDKDVVINEVIASGKGKDGPNDPVYELDADIVFAFTQGISHSSFYHNNIPLGWGGSPKLAMEKGFIDFFSKQLKSKGTLKKEGLAFEDIGENLIFISHTETEDPPSFKGQTKDLISNSFIEQFMIQQINRKLTEWAKENPLELDKVNKQIEVNQESRLTSASVKQLTKEKLSGEIKLSAKILKLTECDSDDVNITEVYFCEGDSASSIKDARDAKFQAIYAMRGKPKNVMKMNLGKILEHQILMDILKVIGTGVQLGGKKNQIGDYDFTKRKFGKYIIASDADSDGDHIACLMLTIFYTLMPDLLEKGCVYRLLTPLFVNELKDGDIKEAYTDKDQDEIIKKFGDKIKKTSRYKGLGEWRSEDIEPYIDPNKNRKLVQYTIEDAKKAKEVIEMWMAGDAEVRRTFINEHGDEYKDLDFSGGSE